MHFRPSLRRAPHYTCERGSRTLACRHGECAASHRPPPAGFLRHLTAQSSFFCENVSTLSPHIPQSFTPDFSRLQRPRYYQGIYTEDMPKRSGNWCAAQRCDQAALSFRPVFLKYSFCRLQQDRAAQSTSTRFTARRQHPPGGPLRARGGQTSGDLNASCARAGGIARDCV